MVERRIYNPKGISLIEIIAALAILATVAAISLSGIFSQLNAARERATILDMKELHRAIVGNPELGIFGSLGDMGKLPDTLKDLIVKPAGAPDFNHNHTNRVGMGWRGPYLNGFSEDDVIRDKWGTPYQYSPTGPNAGQIISAGPDKDINTTADNIVYPADGPLKTAGSFLLMVLVNRIAEPCGVTVNIYSTDNGGESATILTKTTGVDGSAYPGFFFHDLKHGIHAVKVTHTGTKDGVSYTVVRTVNVGIGANAQRDYEFRLQTQADAKLKI